jgi:hypothetical protein
MTAVGEARYAIDARALYKSFRDVRALDGLTLKVRDGEVLDYSALMVQARLRLSEYCWASRSLILVT